MARPLVIAVVNENDKVTVPWETKVRCGFMEGRRKVEQLPTTVQQGLSSTVAAISECWQAFVNWLTDLFHLLHFYRIP